MMLLVDYPARCLPAKKAQNVFKAGFPVDGVLAIGAAPVVGR